MTTAHTFTENGRRSLSLEDLISGLWLYVRDTVDWRNTPISSVTDDSRRVRPGSLFIAVRGEECDGHKFMADAVRRGAVAVICRRPPAKNPGCPVIIASDTRYALSAVSARFYDTTGSGPKAVGVTGTNGKTTTTYLLRAILKEAGHRPGLIGSLEYDLGQRCIESGQTTPHPLQLHSMLDEMKYGKLTHAVMEVSSHSLVHRRVAHVPFDMAVLTNVTEDHLDFHGGMEQYIRAKGMLFGQLSRDAVAILNADCPVWKRYSRATRATVLTYGINNIADVKLVRCCRSIDGTVMEIRNPLETLRFTTPLVGDFNCENILAAAAAGFAAGVDGATFRRALEKFNGVPGRLEKVQIKGGSGLPSFFVDYAHTPDALKKILNTLYPLTKGQLICVFGCGGDRERAKRAKMGHIATSIADVSVVTSDNSRSERTEDIISDISGGVNMSGGRYFTELDRRRAIEKALAIANSGDDVIVVCGKGAESFQHIGDTKLPFDDRVVCRQAMANVVSGKRKTA